MSKDFCAPYAGKTQWRMWVCLLYHYRLHRIAPHTVILIIYYTKKSTLWSEGLNVLIELANSDQLRFKMFQFNVKSIQWSIHAELNWLSIPFQSMNWSEPCHLPSLLHSKCDTSKQWILSTNFIRSFKSQNVVHYSMTFSFSLSSCTLHHAEL